MVLTVFEALVAIEAVTLALLAFRGSGHGLGKPKADAPRNA
jgi:hypothetical protein